MRIDLLKSAELDFFAEYPQGFEDPMMEAIKKKHKPEKMHEMALEAFDKDKFGFIEETLENMIKVVTRSSMVSVFEKPKFRDFARSLSTDEKEILVGGLYNLIHGNQEEGFLMMVDILKRGKLAKWSIMTICLYYYYPQTEVFVKPTTAKGIIKTFELEGIIYKPQPYYEFYTKYRNMILEMRKQVDERLGPDNAAFSGFLMMTMNQNK